MQVGWPVSIETSNKGNVSGWGADAFRPDRPEQYRRIHVRYSQRR